MARLGYRLEAGGGGEGSRGHEPRVRLTPPSVRPTCREYSINRRSPESREWPGPTPEGEAKVLAKNNELIRRFVG